jgi:hypothetical protein
MTAENTVINIIGKKALVTCNAWFYAPDGRQYRAAWGTIKAAINAEQALGIKVNRQSADWYLQVGNLTIAGCQIHYVVETPHCVLGNVKDWSASAEVGIKEYSRPSGVYNADGDLP